MRTPLITTALLGHAPEGRTYTVWEALFEQDLDPPWKWLG